MFKLFPYTPLHNREKISNFFFLEMIKACPLMNKFEKKNSWESVFGLIMALLKVAQNVNAAAGQ